MVIQSPTMEDNDVVITGMSGRFPESDNLEELVKHLYEGIDMITEDDRRWPQGLHGLPKGGGKLKSLSDFDTEFFKISSKQAQHMDPQSRIQLEVTYEALVDAGYNVQEFQKTKTGVFMATSSTDTRDIICGTETKPTGYHMMGTLPGFFANRISQAFDLNGPSFNIDNGCSASITALVQAISAVRSKECDAAIVATSNLCLLPHNNISVHQINALSPDGRCNCFSADANGYVRSEAVVAILIQRRSAARRVYATIRAGRTNVDGYRPQGFSYPSKAMQCRLAEETYKDAGLSPQDVTYFEAHGTATAAGDFEELSGIVELFCKGRETPLLIGSIKSNFGHPEPSSGLCSIVKVLISMENGVIPANLHYRTGNPNIPALSDGRLKVVDKNMPWEGGIVSINSFGFGGSNGHVVLDSKIGSRNSSTKYYSLSIPRLVVASGRTKEAVQKLLTLACAHKDNSELHALLDAIHIKNIPGHQHRGYALLGDQYFEELSIIDDNIRRPIWFSFTKSYYGLTKSVQSLLKLPVFKESVERSASILQAYGYDLISAFNENKDTKDVLFATVALVTIQIALVDLLQNLNINSDGNVGHSIGKIACSYASGDFKFEQAITYAHWYGCNLLKKENSIPIKHNYEKYDVNLYMNGEDNYNGLLIGVDNFLNTMHENDPVSAKIPENAIVVEFGQETTSTYEKFALLSFETEDPCRHFLTSIGRLYNAGIQPQTSRLYPPVKWPVSRGTPGLSSHVLWNHSTEWSVPRYQDLARTNGNKIDFDLTLPEHAFLSGNNIDGKVMFPVSGYLFHVWQTYSKIENFNMEDKRVVFENVTFKKYVMIQDSNVQLQISVLPRTGSFEICGTDTDNEVLATGVIRLVTDDINAKDTKQSPKEIIFDEAVLPLTSEDIYKEFKLRGYAYDGLFRGLITIDPLFESGTVSWNNDWIAFIDTIFQFDIIGRYTRDLYLPSHIQKIIIDPKMIVQNTTQNNNNQIKIYKHQKKNLIETAGLLIDDLKWSPHKRQSNEKTPTLEKCIFYPYDATMCNSDPEVLLKKEDVLKTILQIVIENVNMLQIKVCELASDNTILIKDFIEISYVEPAVRLESILCIGPQYQLNDEFTSDRIKVVQTNGQCGITEVDCHLIIASNIIAKTNVTEEIQRLKLSLAKSGMILLKESNEAFDKVQHLVEESGLFIVSRQVHENVAYILMSVRKDVPKQHQVIEIPSCDDDYQWVNIVKDTVTKNNDGDSRIYLVSYDYDSGIIGMCHCLRKEEGGNKIRVYFLPGINEPFNVKNTLYSAQVKKDLAVNILRNCVWGTYRHLKLQNEMTSSLRPKFQAEKSYVLIGGLGGFGLELANWLVMHGVTKLVFNSRRGIWTGYQSWCIRRWQSQGVKVLVSNEDASTIDGAVGLLHEASALGDVGGIFNMAVVLEDAVLANQSPDSFRASAIPKIKVTRSLDIASRELSPKLDHFVVFSSLSCGRGNYGQTNYGFANSAMERIVEQRCEDGFPGLVIQWGPVGDVGIMENIPNDDHLQMGTVQQKISSCLETLEVLLYQPHAVVASCVVADKQRKDSHLPRKNVCDQIADILCIADTNSVSQSATLGSLGMDSIMAVEIHRALLQADLGFNFTMDKIKSLSFAELKNMDKDNLEKNV